MAGFGTRAPGRGAVDGHLGLRMRGQLPVDSLTLGVAGGLSERVGDIIVSELALAGSHGQHFTGARDGRLRRAGEPSHRKRLRSKPGGN
jgi:hypothetical protein